MNFFVFIYLLTIIKQVYRRLKKKPTDLSLLSEQIAYFPCLVNSKPLPINIIWFKYNSLLVTDNRMAIFPSGKINLIIHLLIINTKLKLYSFFYII